MNKSQNLTIALLLLSAAILSVMLFSTFVGTSSSPAWADSASTAMGDYVVCTAHWSSSTDLLYIIDRRVQRLNVYYIDTNQNRIVRRDSVDLKRIFSSN